MGTQNDFIAMHPFHLQVKLLLPVNTLITASALTHSRESPLPSQRPALAGLQCCELRPVEGERSPQGSLSLSNPRLWASSFPVFWILCTLEILELSVLTSQLWLWCIRDHHSRLSAGRVMAAPSCYLINKLRDRRSMICAAAPELTRELSLCSIWMAGM